jgi:hypothetical protein
MSKYVAWRWITYNFIVANVSVRRLQHIQSRMNSVAIFYPRLHREIQSLFVVLRLKDSLLLRVVGVLHTDFKRSCLAAMILSVFQDPRKPQP